MSQQTVYRSNGSNGRYTVISNKLAQDSRLSYETRGLLLELLSRPADWEITIMGIVAGGQAGRDRVLRMLKEAEQFGYIKADQSRREDGTLSKKSYSVSDDPGRANSAPEQPVPEIQGEDRKPVTGKPIPENPTQQSKERNKLKSAAEAREGISIEELRDKLLDAAGGIVTSTAMAEPQRWLAAGYDLDADILPVIKAKVAHWTRGNISSWAFFTKAIAAAHATRLAPIEAAPPTTAPTPRPDRPKSWSQRQAELRAQLGDIMAARAAKRAGGAHAVL